MRIGKGAGFASVALLVSLLLAPAAGADFKPGRYAGTTSQGMSIGFKATEETVKKFVFEVTAECEDGNAVRVNPVESATAAISDKGTFKGTFRGDGATVVAGKLKRRHGEGTIIVSATHPETGAGCSGSVEWSARRLKKQPAAGG